MLLAQNYEEIKIYKLSNTFQSITADKRFLRAVKLTTAFTLDLSNNRIITCIT